MRIRLLPRSGSRFLFFLLACFLVFTLIAGVLLAEVTVHPGRNVQNPADEMRIRQTAQRNQYDLADIAIAAQDGATLRAWSLRPPNPNGNAVILLHGLGDNRTGMTGYAELLLSHGYSVLMPDARGHGRSDGNLVTFGLLETDDIRRWLDWLQQKNGRADNVPPGSTRPQQVPSCIFGLGESMGAAQLLQALRTETRFCAVVAESPFASFREIGYDRVGQPFNTGPWLGRTILRPIVEFAFLYARLKYKLDFEQVSPEDAVARTKVPISLIHGKADSNIPVRHADLLVARNPGISLWEVPNADHCGAMSTAPEDFAEKVLNWFMSHTGGLGPKSITLELLPATGTALRIGFARRGSSYQHDFRITQALRCLSPPYPLPAPRFAQSREGTQPSSAQCVQQAQHPNKDNYESWISGYRMGPLRSGGRDPHHIQLTISL